MTQFSLGSANISIINTGDLSLSLKDMMDVPERERESYSQFFEPKLQFPTQSVLVSSSGQNMLIDPSDYSLIRAYDADFASMIPPNYKQPPALDMQLKTIGVSPENIAFVVITHNHYDHISGLTKKSDEKYIPSFPSAKYFLGREDWEDERIQKAIKNEGSPEAKSLGVVKTAGMMELVSEKRTLTDEVEIVPSPGESPGHQTVRVNSRGSTLYCVGDLFHHPVEIENLAWMATWCEPGRMLESRKGLVERALKENALILPTHMPLGRIVEDNETASKVRFVPEEDPCDEA